MSKISSFTWNDGAVVASCDIIVTFKSAVSSSITHPNCSNQSSKNDHPAWPHRDLPQTLRELPVLLFTDVGLIDSQWLLSS